MHIPANPNISTTTATSISGEKPAARAAEDGDFLMSWESMAGLRSRGYVVVGLRWRSFCGGGFRFSSLCCCGGEVRRW